jgi:DNA-binding transcriptional LysR family regulator
MQLSAHDCIALRENDEDATLWRFSQDNQPLSVRVRPKLASNDGDVIRQWALDGLGIIVRSEWSVADDVRAGRLVRILENFPTPSADVVALLGPSHARVARTQSFLDHLRANLAPPPWRR